MIVKETRRSFREWSVDLRRQEARRRIAGLQALIRLEERGYRLYLEGQARGFFDSFSHAASHVLTLIKNNKLSRSRAPSDWDLLGGGP